MKDSAVVQCYTSVALGLNHHALNIRGPGGAVGLELFSRVTLWCNLCYAGKDLKLLLASVQHKL